MPGDLHKGASVVATTAIRVELPRPGVYKRSVKPAFHRAARVPAKSRPRRRARPNSDGSSSKPRDDEAERERNPSAPVYRLPHLAAYARS